MLVAVAVPEDTVAVTCTVFPELIPLIRLDVVTAYVDVYPSALRTVIEEELIVVTVPV